MSRLDRGQEVLFDTLTNRTLASQEYATAILLPCALGWAGQIALTGVVLAMLIGYLRTEMYERDSGARKALVWTVVSVSVAQAGMNFASIGYWMVKQDRDATSLLHPTALDGIQTLSIAINAPLVQGFLAMRAARLIALRWARHLVLACFAILIILEFGAIIFATVLNVLFHLNRVSSGLLQAVTYGLISGVWLVLSAVIDVAISVFLVLVLRRRIAGFNAATDGRLRALSRLAIQSASYTALVASLGFLFTFATPFDDLLWSCAPYAFWYLLSACYALALLTTLSSRALILRKNSAPPQPSVPTRMSEQAQSPLAEGPVMVKEVGVEGLSESVGSRGRGPGRMYPGAPGSGSTSGSSPGLATGSGSGSRSGTRTARTIGNRLLAKSGFRKNETSPSSSADTASAFKRGGSPLPAAHLAYAGSGGRGMGAGDTFPGGVHSSGIQVEQEISVHVDEHDADHLLGLGLDPDLLGGTRLPRRRSPELSAC